MGVNGPGGVPAALVVGLTTVLVAVNLPFVGWIVNVTLTLIGAGALSGWNPGRVASRGAPRRRHGTGWGREAPYVALPVMNG